MKFEEKFENELREIESSIISVYRNNPELVDSQVERAVAAAIKLNNSIIKGNTRPDHSLSSLDLTVFEFIQEVVDTLLQSNNVITVNDLVQCLKRVRKSVQKWNKRFGRQGYLDFVSKYV
jgi:hypothetical protein